MRTHPISRGCFLPPFQNVPLGVCRSIKADPEPNEVPTPTHLALGCHLQADYEINGLQLRGLLCQGRRFGDNFAFIFHF